MQDEPTLEDVKWRLNTESSFIRLFSDAATDDNMGMTYNHIQDSIGKLTQAAHKLKLLVARRDNLVVSDTNR